MQDDTPYLIPRREKNEPILPETVLFFLAPQEKKTAERCGILGDAHRHFLFNANLWSVPIDKNGASFAVAGPAVGAPMAILVLEKLIALGAKRVIIHGWCGGIDPGLSIGDVFLPTTGISEEGVSPLYPSVGTPEVDPSLQQDLAQHLVGRGMDPQVGSCWSTDAPYMETKEKVRCFSGQGAMAVDMEFTALATVARFRGVALAAAFIVSDLLTDKGHVSGFGNKNFRTTKETLFNALSTFCGTKNHVHH